MSIVSENLRFLRKKMRLTQEEMAGKIGIKRSLVGAYEEGRADPRLSNLINFSQVFGIAVDHLINRDLTALSQQDLEKLEKGGNLASAGAGPGRVLAITVDKQQRENIELVPQKAAAGYLNGYSDPEFLEELPKFQLPNLPRDATYRAFEISGDSMLPLQPGTIVIGEYVERIEEVKSGRTYVLVTSKEGVVYKRVFNYLDEKGKLFLVSDNTQYSGYEVEAGEVMEIWAAKAYISVHFPDQSDKEDISVNQLAAIVLDLQKEVMKLKDNA